MEWDSQLEKKSVFIEYMYSIRFIKLNGRTIKPIQCLYVLIYILGHEKH